MARLCDVISSCRRLEKTLETHIPGSHFWGTTLDDCIVVLPDITTLRANSPWSTKALAFLCTHDKLFAQGVSVAETTI